jgi:hypothetical protein
MHRVTSSPNFDVVLPGSEAMYGHAGEAYGLVSDAYFDPSRSLGLVFVNNGVGTGYQTNSSSAFYTIEQEVFNAMEAHGNLSACAASVAVQSSESDEHFYFPNPVVGHLEISGIQADTGHTVQIHSMEGKLLKTVHLGKGTTTVDVQDLPSGAYLLVAEGKTYRFVVMN